MAAIAMTGAIGSGTIIPPGSGTYWIDERYLARNPNLAVKSTKRILANYDDSNRCLPHQPHLGIASTIQARPTTPPQPIAPRRIAMNYSARKFATSIFISEPVHNLIHREVLEADGVSFKSRRAKDEQNSEFSPRPTTGSAPPC
jgi:hypothetical protein